MAGAGEISYTEVVIKNTDKKGIGVWHYWK